MDNQNQKNLRQKLLAIGKEFKTFATTEESESKKKGTKESSYRYTPGWAIVEQVREKLDKEGIKLEPNCEAEHHEMITYPVYKIVNDMITPFEKKEMYVTVTVTYTFVDTETGETVGPFRQIAAGANGTDKSISSALSLAERYFLLKYFQITTHEPDSEPDMHDSENLPGLTKAQQPISAPEKFTGGARQTGISQPARAALPVQVFQQPQNPHPSNALPTTASSMTPEQTYSKAIEALSYFQEGTDSHNKTLAYWMTQLRIAGYDTSEPAFMQTIVTTAQAKRLGINR